jgi:hypothetical protein
MAINDGTSAVVTVAATPGRASAPVTASATWAARSAAGVS